MAQTSSLDQLMEENRRLQETIRQRDAFIHRIFGRYLTDEVLEEILAEGNDFKLGGSDGSSRSCSATCAAPRSSPNRWTRQISSACSTTISGK